MDKININLLPPEIKLKAKKEAKQSLINKLSVGLLALLVLATSSVLALVIFQGAALNALRSDIKIEINRIEAKKDTEAVIRLLRNRIDTINQFSNEKYKQKDILVLLTRLFPSGVNIKSLGINQTDKVAINGETSDTLALKTLFENLTDPKENEGKITSVQIQSLSRTKLGIISLDLSVQLSKSALE